MDTFDRRILLAVTGLSPQIVTETLYALAVAADDPWIPTEIRILTTREGAERARLTLLSEAPGWFHRLRADYGLPPIAFDAANLIVVPDADGRPLDDIRSPADNERVADTITAAVRELSADPRTQLHVSLAGGRKTMGFYLGYALSLYGRAQDRLSHVLVSPQFESHPEFFYPTPASHVIYTPAPERRPLDTREARVTLAEIPFVRLREGLSLPLLEGRMSFSDTVAAAQRAIEAPHLTLDPARHCVRAGGVEVAMTPAVFAFYAMFAERALRRAEPLTWRDDEYRDEYLLAYRRVLGPLSEHVDKTARRLDASAKEHFQEQKAEAKRAIVGVLGKPAARPYLLAEYGKRPSTRFGLSLPRDAIAFLPQSPR